LAVAAELVNGDATKPRKTREVRKNKK